MKKRKPLRTADATYLHLSNTENFQKFFRGLIEFLQKKLQRVFVDRSEPYYICGDTHDFKYLWIYTEKKGLDFYAAKNLLDDFFFRELKCTCEVLGGDKEVRRRQLEAFGVDFGEPGKREVDIVSGWELTKIDRGIF